jgi:hypothetical protein
MISKPVAYFRFLSCTYRQLICFLFASSFALSPFASLAQGPDDGYTKAPVKSKNGKGFHFGLYMGSLFANRYTASTYDGYGFDVDGYKHDFSNSAMNQKINYEYGGGNGQTDRIAQALGVNHGDWTFGESDMPVNMKYNASFMVGLDMRYGLNKRSGLILNVNGSKMNVGGNFTITTTSTQIGIPVSNQIRTFSIIGGEQRLVFGLGYQYLLGDNEKVNCFIEGGATCTLVKFDRNLISINSLVIDLTTYYNPQNYITYRAKNLTGVGFGAFAGFGVNLSMSPKWTVQLVYDPSYEKINIGEAPTYKLQHTLGLRAYYIL